MNEVTAAAKPSANRIQCPTSNSRAVCFRKATEWTRRALCKHDSVPGPEEGHREQSFADHHDQAAEDPVPGRLHTPGKDQGTDTCDPADETEGREEVARTPDGRERHRGLERVRYVVEGIRIDNQRIEHEGTEKDHQDPRMRQDERERDLSFVHGLLLWFRRYNGCSDLRRNLASTAGATTAKRIAR